MRDLLRTVQCDFTVTRTAPGRLDVSLDTRDIFTIAALGRHAAALERLLVALDTDTMRVSAPSA